MPMDMDLSAMNPSGPHQLPFNPQQPAVVDGASIQHQSQPQPYSQPQASPPAKRRRTASSSLSDCCRTCRLRKVKCTGNPGNGPCSNCARLDLSCPFVVAGDGSPGDKISRVKPSHSVTEAGTARKRAQRACSQCHSQKTKCSGDLPRCKRCEANGMNCEYTAAKRKFANVKHDKSAAVETPSSVSVAPQPTPSATATATPSATPPLPSESQSASLSPPVNGKKASGNFPLTLDTSILTAEDLLVRKNFLLKHLDAYFEFIYWLPCMGFFRPETAYRQVYDGTFDAPTATALCAITCFFVGPSQASKEFGMKCSDEIEFFIFRNVHKFSDRVLLPYALNLSFNFLNGSFSKVWQCFGLASRLMTGLQLNWDSSSRGKSFYTQELHRRVAWQFFVMDRLLAGGYEEYISCRAENMKIRLPCYEVAFWENSPVVTERLTEKNTKAKAIGLHGLNVRIIDIVHRIQAWSKKLATRTSLEPSKVMEDINNFQSELTCLHLALPDDIRLGDQSIAKYIPSPERQGYVFLHTHLSVGHIDLYRFALPGILDPNKNDVLRRLPQDFVERCRKQAVAHALCTGRFCKAIQEEANKLPMGEKPYLAGDCTIPHMATQSLRVFLITMQHQIYDNLTEGTTAPLWRFQHPDESHIRSLIEDGLFAVSAPWNPILMTCTQAHTNNTAMYSEFNKTQKFADQKGTVGFVGSKVPGGVTRLPGPHYILENANYGVVEQEKRARAADAAAADRWFRGPEEGNEPSPYNPPEPDFDSEYGPPGVPLLLAVARNSAVGDLDVQPNMYDASANANGDTTAKDDSLLMPGRMWVAGGMGGPDDGQYLDISCDPNANGTMSMLQMQTAESMMFPPPAPHPHPQGPPPSAAHAHAGTGASVNAPPPPPPFMPNQPGIFMNGGYAPQYTDASAAESAAYMQQAGFN